ncbi:hypothetical membrane protein [Campylobacter iguaniorum]|uniref:Hypothetical membrane protein n=1 Tax=Campylobacter iguaniorum TaxID=1244531 RepID=A0A076FE38_9BACT|nr:hypothetical protein [Campylobacter iguaniorum]AII14089.1 hypothetical membrane protein [Campylobacter iguaniorum]
MFKLIKSTIFWTLLYKFRKKVLLILALVLVIFFSNFIYSDVVNYLNLTSQTELIKYALITKWVIVLSSLFVIVALVFNIFNAKNSKKDEAINAKIPEPKPKNKIKSSDLSEREKSFLNKKIRSKTEILMDKKSKD